MFKRLGIACRMAGWLNGWTGLRQALILVIGLQTASSLNPGRCELTVRVDAAGGAPRWVVNGEPKPARVFWGAPGPSQIAVSPAPQTVAFEFAALGSSSNATMHFRFGQSAGDVFLDNIQVTDLSGSSEVLPRCDFEGGPLSFQRDWTFWPPDAANTVGTVSTVPDRGEDGSGALRITLEAPPQGAWPDFHIYHHPNLVLVEGHRYRVKFWVQAQPARSLTVAFYQPGEPFVFLGGPAECFVQQIQLAASAGVDFVSFPVGMPWPKPGESADWYNIDLACRMVLNANPHALLIPRIPMDPPAWWGQAHPEEVMQWENGRRDHAVPASPAYRHDAARQLEALVRHLEEKFGDHVAGYHPCGQNTGEWFYEGSWEPPLSGYAPADLEGWRRWLRKRYLSVEALRGKWADSVVSFETASLPTPAARHHSPAGVFRDPATERPLIDFAEFQQETMADCVCELAHAVRTASQGRKLVLFFYGYVFEFGALPNGPTVSGHYALRRALDCPDIDVLCSPISYFDRGLGGNAPAMSAAESVALAGKMWLNEDDTHTFLATGDQPGSMDHARTLEESNQELRRNLAQEGCRNFGTWWMDLGATGWFNDPRMWSEMSRMRLMDQALQAQPSAFRPEVAAVLDEESMCYVAADGARVTRPGVYEARAALGRLGAPYGQYLLDDVVAGRVHAKLVVFLNAWRLTADQRARLAVATQGSGCVWCSAPGYFDSDRASPEAMKELTGFEMKSVALEKAWAKPTDAGRRLGLSQEFGAEGLIEPLFTPVSAKAEEVLATYGDGPPAVAWHHGREGISMFVGVPRLTSELLRIAAREAGVHLFTQSDCNVYANGPFLALHASQDGPLEVDTGESASVSDVVTGQVIGRGPKLSLQLKRGDTRVFSSLRIAAGPQSGTQARAASEQTSYPDGRPAATLRFEAKDQGPVLRHGGGPAECDKLGARDVWVFEADGKYYMHYDGAGPKGWLACLATSTNLTDWVKHGPILDFGKPGEDDSASASYGVTFFDGETWHMFYLGTPHTSPAPDLIPAFPYLTLKAQSRSPAGPWIKQREVAPFRCTPKTYYDVTASPGQIVRQNGEYLMFFSAASNDSQGTHRTIGIARTQDLNGAWRVAPQPTLPPAEQIENTSLYQEPTSQTWFMFTDHIGLEGFEYTDAVWVYWTKDLNQWDPAHKAVVLDGKNCPWSQKCIGLPSAIRVGNRLAVFYDAPGGESKSHMRRDVGLAWLELPLQTPPP